MQALINFLFILFFVIILIGGAIATVFAAIHCGWLSLFLGKMVFWAWIFGMCPM